MTHLKEICAVPEFFPPIHARSYICRNGDWTFSCACGFHSLPYVTEREAVEHPCEVELLLAESQLRERRLYAKG